MVVLHFILSCFAIISYNISSYYNAASKGSGRISADFVDFRYDAMTIDAKLVDRHLRLLKSFETALRLL